MTISRAMLLYGTEEPVAPVRRLVAGPLSAELDGGNLRYLRFGEVEVLRGISFLIRSNTWATHSPEMVDLEVEETGEAFVVTYRASVRDGAQALDYTARIDGAASGLTFRCAIDARTDFETCRAGFVVLHPASVAGGAVRIEQVDGVHRDSHFPLLIDPVQPMRDLAALTHAPASGLSATCRMQGDTFEMEDQRNWTDASFKTYVRPLSRPWPYTLPAGSRTEQAVTLTVAGPPARVTHHAAATPIRVEIGVALGPMPDIALGCTPAEARAALAHTPALAAAGVAALVCRFDVGEGHGADDLRNFRDLADACGAAVELQIVVRSVSAYAAELLAAAAAVRDAGLVPRAIAVSPAADLKSVTPGQAWPDCPAMAPFYEAARAAFPAMRLGGGTFAYFTELNRKRPDPALLDFLTLSTSPIVHAADDRSVMESLEALPAVIASLRAICGGKPFAVGPSVIGFRDNPYGATPLANPRQVRQPMSGADPRQHALFNAAWTLGYIARFAAGGAARVAVSAPAGAFGIVGGAGPSPVFSVIAGCAALRGATVHAATTSREQDLLALCAVRPGEAELWLANLTPQSLTVAIPDRFHGGQFARLDADTCAAARAGGEAMSPVALQGGADTLTMGAYAVIRARATHAQDRGDWTERLERQ